MQTTTDRYFMSEEDLLRANGKTLSEYRQCKDELRALDGEAVRAAKMLDAVASFLRNLDPKTVCHGWH